MNKSKWIKKQYWELTLRQCVSPGYGNDDFNSDPVCLENDKDYDQMMYDLSRNGGHHTHSGAKSCTCGGNGIVNLCNVGDAKGMSMWTKI